MRTRSRGVWAGPKTEWDEVRRYLAQDVGVWSWEIDAFYAQHQNAGSVLNALDLIKTMDDLENVGLANANLSAVDLGRRLGRIKRGGDTRERVRYFLKHFNWATEFKIPRSVLEEVSVLEWRAAELGNPYLFLEPFMDAQLFRKQDENEVASALNVCTNFSACWLSEAELEDDEFAKRMEVAAFYHFCLHYLMRNANRDRIHEMEIREAMLKFAELIQLEWSSEIDSFDPSLGLFAEHPLCVEEEEPPSLTESYAECSRRLPELRLSDWNAYHRLFNRIEFAHVPESGRFVTLRETIMAERQLPDQLDMVQSSVLVKRELKEALAPLRKRARRKKTLAEEAFGLSLDSDDPDSSSEDDDDE